jgi:uncharacterized membrane protein
LKQVKEITMPETTKTPPPSHIQDVVRASNDLHAEHQRSTPRPTRMLKSTTAALGHPAAVIVLLLFTAIWISANRALSQSGGHPFDGSTYPLLDTIYGFLAFAITLLILATQQHENQLSESRAKITLELGILNEQKLSKILEMLDHLRRDMPDVATISDPAIDALSKSPDAQSLLEDIQESRRVSDAEQPPHM